MCRLPAPYQDLQLTFNVTSNNVTCTARGGFPKSKVRWSAFNTSSDEEVDLPGAGTSHQEDPTLKTFNVSSSVVAPLRELENVTCRIRNPLTEDMTEITRKVPGKVPGSAPYQDLQLTFNEASNNVTCTARGGFPKSEVRWSAFNTSSDEEVDLPGAGTSHQEDPTLKTFNVSSSVVAPLRELENVTCRIRNPLTGDTTEITGKVPGSDEGLGLDTKWVIVVAVLAGLTRLAIIAAFYFYKKFPGIRRRLINPCVSASTNTVSSPPVEGDAPASNMSGGNSSPPVEGDAPAGEDETALLNSDKKNTQEADKLAENNETPSTSAGDLTQGPSGGNRSDGNVKLGKTGALYHKVCTNADDDEARQKEEISADKVTELESTVGI
ncbi:uncharacterized protein [Embiotoca jacksoni]|uniref:uncharacterized protein n=1 Tax=Embiotoca jacksoni TaxID=100190 RepID=UPI00370388EC